MASTTSSAPAIRMPLDPPLQHDPGRGGAAGLGTKPKYDPMPIFEQILNGDYKKLPLYTTSFFPLAYQCLGKQFPPEQDRKSGR